MFYVCTYFFFYDTREVKNACELRPVISTHENRCISKMLMANMEVVSLGIAWDIKYTRMNFLVGDRTQTAVLIVHYISGIRWF